MVYRIYVEKKPGFDGEAQGLLHELVDLVGIQNLTGLRLLNRYDVEGIDAVLFQQAVPTVFSEPPVDVTYDKLPDAKNVFAVEYLPGQFDQRADSASECIQLLSQGERPAVRSARVYLLVSSSILLSLEGGSRRPRLSAGRRPDRRRPGRHQEVRHQPRRSPRGKP